MKSKEDIPLRIGCFSTFGVVYVDRKPAFKSFVES